MADFLKLSAETWVNLDHVVYVRLDGKGSATAYQDLTDATGRATSLPFNSEEGATLAAWLVGQQQPSAQDHIRAIRF